MWVDLTLEGKPYNQNIDDKWFYTHHPVHQSSSHDLKSAFSQLYEEGKTLDFELSVSSSNLPNSVSRSRGKDFDDKKCKGSCQGFVMDKHIVVIGSSSEGKESADSRTGSTIITGTGHRQQHKPTAVTSQPFSSSSKLLSDMRRSLRKSCVTRQASRLEVNNCQRQSSGHNSSSSNSSISSSLNPGFGAKSITKTSEHHLKSTQGVGSFSRMTHASMNKSKVSSLFSSTLKIHVEDASSNSRRIGKLYNAKATHLEAAKPKILRPKASLVQRRDYQNTCLKPKKKEGLDGTGRRKTAVAGKENAIGRIAVSQKCNGRDQSTFSMVKDQKRTQHKAPQRLVSLKAKNCHPSEGKNLENGSKNRVYFR
ncbi:uncharacterized protein LOC120069558 isoform X2 [Benincasa hispida]|uniref:uncharacterized protein LOC120069558 isoform X2 n=1 Tax=Benincasa hispida TaxID=102211 RepID=UPI0018FF4423|nr:uncharacterized protein LOC120069558 isoform X2 [Benincasa hispida]